MSIRKLGDTIYLDFVTHNPTTGAVSDADSLPTAEVFEDDTDTTVTALTCTKRTAKTGNYRVPIVATSGNGFEIGKSYNVVASATVATIAAKSVIGSFTLDGKRINDLNDIAATAIISDGVTFLGARIDATISSRSTLTAQNVWEYATRTLSSFGTLVSDMATAVWGAVARTLTDKANFTLSSAYDAAKTAAPETGGNIAAIKAKTDNLPTDPADQSAVEAAITAAASTIRGADSDTLKTLSDQIDGIEAGSGATPEEIWEYATRSLTDKAGFTISGTKQTLDDLNDIDVVSILAADLGDSQGFITDSLADLIRKLSWMISNRLVIVRSNGAFTLYKNDDATPAATGTISRSDTQGTRSKATWI